MVATVDEGEEDKVQGGGVVEKEAKKAKKDKAKKAKAQAVEA